MTLIYPRAGEQSSSELRAEAHAHFKRTARELNVLIDDLMQRNTEKSAELVKLVRELKQALGPALAERERLETELREDAGVVNGYALDFDAARHEVGRRLARLRERSGEGRVPE